MFRRFRKRILALAADLRHLKDQPGDLAALLVAAAVGAPHSQW
jgi:hypothetical protein